jgi:hypothetical protein
MFLLLIQFKEHKIQLKHVWLNIRMQLTNLGATYATRLGFLYDTSPNIGYLEKKFVVVIFVF